MKKLLLAFSVVVLIGAGVGASALTAPVSPCSGCKPPGPVCCTSAAGDDYRGTHPN